MSMPIRFPPYRSQLLRMWVEPAGARAPVWRFSLEDVSSGQRAGFADLDALITHLLALMEERSAPRAGESTHGHPPLAQAMSL